MQVLPVGLGGSSLVQDYLAGDAAVAAFYRGSPFDPATYQAKAAELDGTVTGPELSVAQSVVRTAGQAGSVALDAVVRAHGYFVTTGQQPGLFGGPLYSLYKALSAVCLAEELSSLLGKPVMALFWVASDDHDRDEASHAHVIDARNQLRRLSLPVPPGHAHRPLAVTRLGTHIDTVTLALERYFPLNEFRDSYMEMLRGSYHPGATFADAFSGFMGGLLGDLPIGFVDAANPDLKRASRPVLRREAEDPASTETALLDTLERLSAQGYAAQVPVIPGATGLFIDTGTRRDRLQRDGGNFRYRGSGKTVSRRRVLEMIEHETGRVSPNVTLRPVVEGFVFPTLAYVGGPGELAYFGQLAGVFRRHDVGMPVVTPRAALLVVERKVAKVMEKLGLGIDQVRMGEATLGQLARDSVPHDVRVSLSSWRREAAEHASALQRATGAIDPALAGAVLKARNAGLAALGTLEAKIVRAVKRQHETARNQITKARVNLWPDDTPQDRVLGPLQYLMRYGGEFLTAARAAAGSTPWIAARAPAATADVGRRTTAGSE